MLLQVVGIISFCKQMWIIVYILAMLTTNSSTIIVVAFINSAPILCRYDFPDYDL